MDKLKWDVQVTHAKQIVVDEELENVWDVRLMRLILFSMNHSALQKIRNSAKQVWVVELDPEKLMLCFVVSIKWAVMKVISQFVAIK